MTYPVSKEHLARLSDLAELARRLRIPDQPREPLPITDEYLALVPLLDAIVRRIEALESGEAGPNRG